MMARWFRSHAAKLDNAKVQKLSDSLYRAWDSLLCVACVNDGVLAPIEDTAFALRKSKGATQKLIDALIERGLFVKTEKGIEPHDWNQWQYKSDVSTERVQQHRQRQRNVSGNVPVTPSENQRSDTETDAVAKATGGKVPPRQTIFEEGLPWMVRRSGLDDRSCRSVIGRWLRDFGDDAVLAALEQAEAENPVNPVAWITAKFKPREAKESWREREIREGEAAIDKVFQ